MVLQVGSLRGGLWSGTYAWLRMTQPKWLFGLAAQNLLQIQVVGRRIGHLCQLFQQVLQLLVHRLQAVSFLIIVDNVVGLPSYRPLLIYFCVGWHRKRGADATAVHVIVFEEH